MPLQRNGTKSRFTRLLPRTATTCAREKRPAAALYFRNNVPALLPLSQCSSHVCFGGEVNEGFSSTFTFKRTDWKKRYCILRNIGVDANGTLIYRHCAQNGHVVFEYVNAKPTSYEDDDAQALDFASVFGFDLKIVPQSAADSPPPPPQSAFKPNTAFFYIAVRPEYEWILKHAGHYWMVLWQVFEAMANTELLSLNNHVVFKQDVTACKFCKVLGTLHNFRELHAGTMLPIVVLMPMRDNVAGFANLPSALHFSLFKRYARQMLGVYPPPPPPAIRNDNDRRRAEDITVGFQRKLSKHNFINEDEIISHLRRRFKRVLVLDNRGEEISAEREIALVSQMSIFITPPGGCSFSAMFVRTGGTVIFGNICAPGTALLSADSNGYREYVRNGTVLHCHRLEHFIWEPLPMFRKAYLSPERLLDLKRTGELEDRSVATHNFLFYGYNVSLSKLDEEIDLALRHLGVPL